MRNIKSRFYGRLILPFFSAFLIPFACQAGDIEGPRSLGMGSAYTAIADGPDSLRSNPAGIATKKTYSATASYEKLDGDTRAFNVTIIDYKTTNAPVGISYTKQDLLNNERKYGILSFAGSGGKALIGFSAKYFQDEQLDEDDYSYDGGILFFPYKGLRIGAAGKNLKRTSFSYIHKIYSAGIAFKFADSISVSVDYSKDEDALDKDKISAIGLEYNLQKDVTVRGGFTKNDIISIDYYSLGFSLHSSRLSLEYGYRWDKEESDNDIQGFSARFYF